MEEEKNTKKKENNTENEKVKPDSKDKIKKNKLSKKKKIIILIALILILIVILILINLKEPTTDNFVDGKIYDINLAVPYFNYEYNLNLKDDLEQMVIKDVFDSSKADLSKLSSTKNNYIEKIAHKTNISFSNEGIKAAAATFEGRAGGTSCDFDYSYDVPVETINIEKSKITFLRLLTNR